MKKLGLNANSTYLSRKIYWKTFQEASPPQNSVSALEWAIYARIYGPPTLAQIYSSFDFFNLPNSQSSTWRLELASLRTSTKKLEKHELLRIILHRTYVQARSNPNLTKFELWRTPRKRRQQLEKAIKRLSKLQLVKTIDTEGSRDNTTKNYKKIRQSWRRQPRMRKTKVLQSHFNRNENKTPRRQVNTRMSTVFDQTPAAGTPLDGRRLRETSKAGATTNCKLTVHSSRLQKSFLVDIICMMHESQITDCNSINECT